MPSLRPLVRLPRSAWWPVAAHLLWLGSESVASEPRQHDLLKYDWTHVAGVYPSERGLRIEGLGLGLIPPQDDAGSPVTPTPPINLRGPVVQVHGDILFSSAMQLPRGHRASLTFYGDLPLNQDEWRQEGHAVTLHIAENAIIAELQQGIGEPTRQARKLDLERNVSVSLARQRGRLSITVDGEQVMSFDDPGILDPGPVYLGVDTVAGEYFIIESLSVESLDKEGKVTVTSHEMVRAEPTATSLRRLAENHHPHVRIGTAVSTIPLLSDSEYARTLATHFNMVTPENAMKFQAIHPRPAHYAFADADAIVDFAELNEMAVHGHALAWGEALPRWVTDPEREAQPTRDILIEHIETVVGRYRGRVASWDVINEPFEPFAGELRTDSPWYRAMGDTYITVALEAAHRADPDARLYINDFACEERNEKSDALYRLARSLLAEGVPLHGIGFQLHEDMRDDYRPVNAQAFQENVQRFIDLGLEVRISEMDVNLHDDDSPERLRAQADYYRSMLEVPLTTPAFTAFSMWGFSDRYSSLQGWWDADDLGNGLIFDSEHAPKPAFHALQNALAE